MKRTIDLNLTVPAEIMEAAHNVANWATMNGWKSWIIGPVADRRLVIELQKGNEVNYCNCPNCQTRNCPAAIEEEIELANARALYAALKDLVEQHHIYINEDDVDLPDISDAVRILNLHRRKYGIRKTQKSKKKTTKVRSHTT